MSNLIDRYAVGSLNTEIFLVFKTFVILYMWAKIS